MGFAIRFPPKFINYDYNYYFQVYSQIVCQTNKQFVKKTMKFLAREHLRKKSAWSKCTNNLIFFNFLEFYHILVDFLGNAISRSQWQ